MCDERLFRPQAAAFSGRYDVVTLPLKGATSIDGFTDLVLSGIEADRFNLMGLSMGGIVAMAVAGKAPERVQRLALLDTNHRADAPDRRVQRAAQISKVEAGLLRQVMIDEMKPGYLAQANRGRDDLRRLFMDMALDPGPDVFVEQTLALRERADQSGALKRFDGPSLVLCGAEDALCPPQRHLAITELLPQAHFVSIANAGHIPTLEESEAVTAALTYWLARPVVAPNQGDRE
ncbi:MAG: alpha/beta fold hydrolase [Hyphomicrobiales bacterium]|nr:alpha/beta fold hydrolase [Hyphomicrobiales bacterium]